MFKHYGDLKNLRMCNNIRGWVRLTPSMNYTVPPVCSPCHFVVVELYAVCPNCVRFLTMFAIIGALLILFFSGGLNRCLGVWQKRVRKKNANKREHNK